MDRCIQPNKSPLLAVSGRPGKKCTQRDKPKKRKKRFYKTVLGDDIRKVGEKNGDKDDKEELGERRGWRNMRERRQGHKRIMSYDESFERKWARLQRQECKRQ